MHALVQAVGALIVALAAAAFAHFGVALKDAPAQQKASVVRRIPIVAAAPGAPCLHAQTRRI
jgi:3-dehydroquinate dehydratase